MPQNRAVTSREYKLILSVDRFEDRKAGSAVFANLVRFLAQRQDAEVRRQKKEERRLTWYLDTPGLALRRNGYVLRVRKEEDGHNVTLKYRHSDRYLSACRNLSPHGKTKFEEDILPPFRSKFALSTKIRLDEEPQVAALSDVLSLFPGLDPEEIEAKEAAPVRTVNGFQANEVSRRLCKLLFDKKDPEVKAALSFWYLGSGEGELPLVAEFSFDYDVDDVGLSDQLEQFPSHVVEGCNRLFESLQRQTAWTNPDFTTKTGYAYNAL